MEKGDEFYIFLQIGSRNQLNRNFIEIAANVALIVQTLTLLKSKSGKVRQTDCRAEI